MFDAGAPSHTIPGMLSKPSQPWSPPSNSGVARSLSRSREAGLGRAAEPWQSTSTAAERGGEAECTREGEIGRGRYIYSLAPSGAPTLALDNLLPLLQRLLLSAREAGPASPRVPYRWKEMV